MGNIVWSGTTNATHDLVLSTDPGDGGQQTGLFEEQDVVLEVYQNLVLIASVDFCISATPINFHQVGMGTDNGDGTLTFHYAWDSDSGVLADLDGCRVGELVTHPGTPPNPPFTVDPPNPTMLNVGGDKGAAMDTQLTLGPKSGTAVPNFTAVQIYRFEYRRCDPEETWHTVDGPIQIIRKVEQSAAGKWIYSVQKSGQTATLDLGP